MKESKTFCALPWVHRFTNIGGEVQVCCSSEEFNNDILADDGERMTFDKVKSDTEVMNSKYMKSLRLKMLNGEWPAICERCRQTEENGGNSRRVFENINFQDVVPELIKETKQDGEIPVKVLSSDFRLGNLCNLSCRMCSPRSSSRWVQVMKKTKQPEQILPGRTDELKIYDYYKSPVMLEQVRAQAPTLRHLHFAGGEPLIVPEMIDALRVCVETGHSSHIRLTYNTNITRLPEEVKELWPKFAGVSLFCSLDGFGAVNDYIRYPSKWSEIDKNLRELDANFKEYGLTQVLFSCTVQIYNILKLEELYEYAASFKYFEPLPQLIDLYSPYAYRTQVLPASLKKLAREKLLAIKAKAEARIAKGEIVSTCGFLSCIDSAISFMDGEDLSRDIEFFFQTAFAKDRESKHELFAVVPELRAVFMQQAAEASL